MQQQLFKVRDMRHKEKFQIDDIYLNGYAKKIGIYGTGVYLSLCRHANNEQFCWPSLKKMAEELDISLPMVQRGIKLLIKYNIIIKERMGKKLNNRYTLVDKSEWSDISITMQPQTSHVCNSRPVHSKDTHIRNTHTKEGLYFLYGNERCKVVPNTRIAGKYRILVKGQWQDYGGKIKDLKEETEVK